MRLEPDLLLDQDRDDSAQRRRPAMIAAATTASAAALPRRSEPVRIGVAWSDRGQPGRSLALERLDRVEQQEQAEAGRQGPHRRGPRTRPA